MIWSHVQPSGINSTYLLLGAFTCIFMLTSGFIKKRLYLGEANIAFAAGIIFGPLAADVINPTRWSNPNEAVIEISRVVLVIQCFAIGVELRKQYIQEEWRSLFWMLVPVMVCGWLISSLGIRFMAPALSFKACMACAACFNAIDPILAATVINGRAAERVPKHLRDLLLAESACNDITTTLVLELATLLIQNEHTPGKAAYQFFVYTFLYEVIFGVVAGLIIGLTMHHAVRYARDKSMDRESFLAIYFTLAVFCCGIGSLLSVDEVLMGFCAGYGFDIDDEFQKDTEDSGVSDVVDLLLNLSYFLFLGAIIPWHSFNSPELGTVPWRLVVGSVLILALRRTPVVILLRRFIPLTCNLREALFVGHFGPIGGGAIFSALFVITQLENGGSRGGRGGSNVALPFDQLSSSIWPVVSFVVLCSSIVHGTTVPFYLLSKHMRTWRLSITSTSDPENDQSSTGRLEKSSTTLSLHRTRSSSISEAGGRRGFFTPGSSVTSDTSNFQSLRSWIHQKTKRSRKSPQVPARAFQFGDNIVIEDALGQVLKQRVVSGHREQAVPVLSGARSALSGLHLYGLPRIGVRRHESSQQPSGETSGSRTPIQNSTNHHMTEAEVLREIQQLYPNSRVRAVRESTDQVSSSLPIKHQQRRRSISFAGERDPVAGPSNIIDVATHGAAG